jgi:hypothetical protein
MRSLHLLAITASPTFARTSLHNIFFSLPQLFCFQTFFRRVASSLAVEKGFLEPGTRYKVQSNPSAATRAIGDDSALLSHLAQRAH